MTQPGPFKNQPQNGSASHQGSVPTKQLLVVKPPQQSQMNPGIVPPTSARTLSPPGRLEDDEISTFFRNRRMIAQGSFGMNPLLKVLLVIAAILTSAVGLWNYHDVFRARAQSFVLGSFGQDLAAIVPVWTKKAKLFQKQARKTAALTESQEAMNAPNEQMIDDTLQRLLAGQWPGVESFTQARCYRWQASHECAIRAFSLPYKGMKASVRPAAAIDAGSLKPRDRMLFAYSSSLLTDAAKSFPQVMALTKQDPAMERLFFDARLKAAVRDGMAADVAVVMAFMPSKGVAESEAAKWRALEFVGRSSKWPTQQAALQQSKKAMAQYLQKFGHQLKSDPVACVLVTSAALKLGLQKNLVNLFSGVDWQRAGAGIDPSLVKAMARIQARALMADGQLPQAAQILTSTSKAGGSDSETEHMLGSVLLEMRNQEKNAEAATHFAAAVKSQQRWESNLGLLQALTRSGRFKEAASLVAPLRQAMQSTNDLWIQLALAEFKLAASKSLPADARKATATEQARILGQLHAKFPWSNRAGILYVEALQRLGKDNEAQAISVKIDDVSSKTSYLSSPEFMGSPTGPLALMR